MNPNCENPFCSLTGRMPGIVPNLDAASAIASVGHLLGISNSSNFRTSGIYDLTYVEISQLRWWPAARYYVHFKWRIPAIATNFDTGYACPLLILSREGGHISTAWTSSESWSGSVHIAANDTSTSSSFMWGVCSKEHDHQAYYTEASGSSRYHHVASA